MNKKFNKSNIILLIASIVLGICLVLQYQTSKNLVGTSKDPEQKMSNLTQEFTDLIKEKNKLKDELSLLDDEVKTYKDEALKREDVISKLKKELDTQKVLSGYYDVKGPGVLITINADPSFGYMSLADNYYYLLAIISYLNNAGADAISINGQRYTNYTEIVPVLDHININGTAFVLPVEIMAIGNKRTFEASLNFTGGVISQMENRGFLIQADYLDDLQINRFEGEKNLKYAVPIDMEEDLE